MLDTRELLRFVLARHSQRHVAATLGVDTRTVRRWSQGSTEPPPYLSDALSLRLLPPVSEVTKESADFRFIDLFAGIGGLRAAFEANGGSCVFTSEWDDFAKKTYLANYPHRPGHVFAGDITTVKAADIPDHEVLLAGFPCQPFSIAGVSKKNALGRPHGFEDLTQGTLFFDVARIISAKRPKAFLLENVKNLVSHDRGRTLATILRVLESELGYNVTCKVIDAKRFVPQHRERILIVGFSEPSDFSWSEVSLPEISSGPKLNSILHSENGSEAAEEPYTVGARARVAAKYTLSDKLWNYLQEYARKHLLRGNGFGFGLVGPKDTARTLSARYYKDGSEILVRQSRGRNPRRLTPRECARLMGFPDDFVIPVSDTRAYKQFGNSVVVPVVAEVARAMRPHVVTAISGRAARAPTVETTV